MVPNGLYHNVVAATVHAVGKPDNKPINLSTQARITVTRKQSKELIQNVLL